MYSDTGTLIAKYSYDVWGNVLSETNATGGAISDTHVAKMQSFRYRSYYYDKDSGFYYLQSRYYDPVTHRFINADGLVSTGTGILGHNMFAYCGNNPIVRFDFTGNSWDNITDFFENLFEPKDENNYFIFAIGCTVAAADGPLPFGDAIALGILLTAASWSRDYDFDLPDLPVPDVKEKESKKDSKSKKQAYYPANPYDFNPKGLIMNVYPGTYNGRIIKWSDPISQAIVFEWNEDFNEGSHYHAMLIEWDGVHKGPHKSPGEPVDEPWNSIYFGE